jgi:hypothetical protein
MVIVCGNNMGDIFRRNALNLGLQVVQRLRRSPMRATATFNFDPRSRRLVNRRRTKPTTRSAHAEVTRSARPAGLRSGPSKFAAAVKTTPIEWPDAVQARRPRRPNKLWGASRRQVGRVKPGATLASTPTPARIRRHRAVPDPHVQPDHGRQHDFSSPVAVANDHFVFTGKADDDSN